MVNEELVDYIKKQLSVGYSAQQIRSAILMQGYSQIEADESINYAMKSTTVDAFSQATAMQNSSNSIQIEKKKKKRGVFLTIWLILILIFTIIGFFLGIFSMVIMTILNGLMDSSVTAMIGGAEQPFWYLILSIVLNFIAIIILIFIFKWKKWAFFTYCFLIVAGIIANFIVFASILNIVLSLIFPLVLYLLVMTKWKNFE